VDLAGEGMREVDFSADYAVYWLCRHEEY